MTNALYPMKQTLVTINSSKVNAFQSGIQTASDSINAANQYLVYDIYVDKIYLGFFMCVFIVFFPVIEGESAYAEMDY